MFEYLRVEDSNSADLLAIKHNICSSLWEVFGVLAIRVLLKGEISFGDITFFVEGLGSNLCHEECESSVDDFEAR